MMIFENPFRLSKLQLVWRVLGLVVFGVICGNLGCGAVYVIPILLVAGFYAYILASKMLRDMEAANAHTQYTSLDSPDAPPIIQPTHSAESSKLELFGPPTDL